MQALQYDKIITYENLYEEYLNASNGKKARRHVIQYQKHAPTRILKLYNRLHKRKYKPKNNYRFYVYEPKKREITANKFEDKIVQKLLCDKVLSVVISPMLIQDNYASQPNKGTHIGITRLTNFLRSYYIENGRDGYILQCDIRKYFDNINREKLMEMIEGLPLDKDLIELQRTIIYHDHPERNSGICIGYQRSQWYAIFYLNGLDHYIKETLHVKYYGRYMDDFYLIHLDKAYLKECYRRIKAIVNDLGLELNPKSCIFPIKNGITFTGYSQHLSKTGKVYVKIKKSSIARARRRFRKMRMKYDSNEISLNKIIESYRAYYAHAKHGNCQSLLHSINLYFMELFPEFIYEINNCTKSNISKDCKINDTLALYERNDDGFIILEFKED